MVFVLPGVKFDLEMIKKYDHPAPRYTSYPPATELSSEFTPDDFRNVLTAAKDKSSPLSLYFHIPFCESACYFCGCNTVISNNKDIAKPYLEHMAQEIKNMAALVDAQRKVLQVHWGGGTPNYLNKQQVKFLWEQITRYFNVVPQAEISMEINPRYVDEDYIFFLREIGFNRISFGIQDFNPQVQVAINRIQSERLLCDVMDWVKVANFDSVNVDLIYGLPYQSLETFRETVQKTIELDPHRVVVFNFAYVPWMKPAQKNIPPEALPPAQERLEILKMTIEELTSSKYLFIGMDHFAKPNDELAIAQRQHTLQRNFQGYTTHGGTELLGFGATSISMLHDTYVQNHKPLKDYYQAISSGILPINRGIQITNNDIIRRDVIMSIMSHFYLNKQAIAQKYHIDFDEYFLRELIALEPLAADGLVNLSANHIQVTDIGRLLIRNIAVVFDTYSQVQGRKFSRAI